MQNFMIERLRVSGSGKVDGVVNFNDGLNIIRGRSNTGKTWILKCIYYLFSSDTRPYSPLTGYTDIEGTFLTKRFGRIVLSRKLDEEFVTVSAESDEIDNGDYATNYKKQGIRYLNDLWLRVIGIDETIEVPKSARYARERISWTNIANVFFADENEIDKSESLVIKDSRYETPLIASLFYLLTGDYKKGIPEILKPEVATAKKKAVVDYIDEQVALLTEKRSDYIKKLEALSAVDIESEMSELSEHIQTIKAEIKELVEESTSIAKQLYEYRQEDAHNRVLIDRYESLISQYKADLQRLDFIAKGEKAVKELPPNGICPFCGGELHTDDSDDESYMAAINAEIRRIASELTVIAATEKSVAYDQDAVTKRIQELQTRQSEINGALDEKNRIIKDYDSNLEQYRDYTSIQTSIDVINDQLGTLGKKKEAEQKKKNQAPLYHAKKEFEDVVGTGFSELLNKILKECNYRSGGYASWDFSTFDILMDGVPKSEDQGKGYRSFLNSVVAQMLYEYFNQDVVFIKPGFLMIDTPLLGLDENEDGFDGETIKKGLYQYFINHQGEGQVIIVDNLNAMPDMDFESYGINVVTYYKDEKEGHTYGFMPSWRKDIPKETA